MSVLSFDNPPCAADPELFYPDNTGGSYTLERRAVQTCKGCPFREPCLAYALKHNERFGVWGGSTEADRERFTRRRRGLPTVERAAPAPSGVRRSRAATDERTLVVAELTRAGMSAAQIAVRVGLSQRRVHDYRVRARQSGQL